MRCGSRDTYLLFLAKKTPKKTENACQVFFFFWVRLALVVRGKRRRIRRESEG